MFMKSKSVLFKEKIWISFLGIIVDLIVLVEFFLILN